LKNPFLPTFFLFFQPLKNVDEQCELYMPLKETGFFDDV